MGEEIGLCLELHRRLDPGLAVQLSARLEPYNPMFLEDPVRPDNFDAMATVAAKCRIPIATAERFTNLREFEMLMRRDAAQYIRPDVCAVGGITTTKKICAAAERYPANERGSNAAKRAFDGSVKDW